MLSLRKYRLFQKRILYVHQTRSHCSLGRTRAHRRRRQLFVIPLRRFLCSSRLDQFVLRWLSVGKSQAPVLGLDVSRFTRPARAHRYGPLAAQGRHDERTPANFASTAALVNPGLKLSCNLRNKSIYCSSIEMPIHVTLLQDILK